MNGYIFSKKPWQDRNYNNCIFFQKYFLAIYLMFTLFNLIYSNKSTVYRCQHHRPNNCGGKCEIPPSSNGTRCEFGPDGRGGEETQISPKWMQGGGKTQISAK